MREMKPSGVEWIGDIPEDWGVAQLGSLFIEHKYKNVGMASDNLLSLSYGKIIRKNVNSVEGLLPESFEGYNIVDDGDIVIRLTDLQNDQRSLRVGLCHERGIITSAYVTIRKRNITTIPAFFYYAIHSYDVYKGFYGMGSGVRQGLNFSGIRKLALPLPSRSEQEAIVAYLDRKCSQVDALVKNVQAQIEQLKAYKQSLISETVTKGLNPNAPMKDSGVEWIGKIPQGWEVRPLKSLFSFGKGLPITKENLIESGVPVISYGQIHAKWNTGVTTHPELMRFVSESYLETNPASLVKRGDLIMADTSEDREGCGNCAYVDTSEPLFAGYHTIILKSMSQKDDKYLAYLFRTDAWRSQLRKSVSGVKLFSISRRILGTTTVLIPNNADELVAHLDEKCSQIDRLIAVKQAKIEQLEAYKKSLIYEVVTGKIDCE